MFEGRSLLIASKHKKERVLAPLFEASLGVRCRTAEDFDTDLLGTFTGEIDRKEDALSTVRNKCLLAMDTYNSDLCVASEGSFGPHPACFLLHANEELLILIDKQHNLEIIGRALSMETNFDGATIETEESLVKFATKVQFPSHALILRQSHESLTDLKKGISSWEQLLAVFQQLKEKNSSCYAETDMRALYNPSRMKVIEQAAQQLLKNIHSCCPQCKLPGFSITALREGLPCELCHKPTLSTLSHLYTCQHCSFTKEVLYPQQKTRESAMYCSWCNP